MEIQIKEEFEKLIPSLSEEEYNGLENSIKEEGCRDALVVWNNFIVDGHNRYQICKKHDIQFKTILKDFKDENEIYLWIIDNQLGRRNISTYARTELHLKKEDILKPKAEERMKLGKEIIDPVQKSEQGRTIHKIAKQSKVSHDTASRVKFIRDNAPDIVKKELRDGNENLSINRVYKDLKKEVKREEIELKRKEDALKGENIDLSEKIDLKLGDFKESLKETNDIDIILTDPPYPIEYIDLWEDLSLFAKNKLKDDGYLIAYSGQYNLPEVIKRLSKHLDYLWTFCLYHEGKTQIVNGVNVICRWKPILIFQKKRSKFKRTIQDYIISESREKSDHDWQQGLSAVKRLIELFSNENDLICDPFSGSGTTAIGCKQLNRRFIGSEIDKEVYNASKKRIDDN